MTRSRTALALVAAAALSSTVALRADVRSDERTKFQLAGALGKVVNFFGGKAARDGVTSTVAIKGSRMMTTSGDSTAQIVDLGEEKIYDLDLKKKSYRVTTFADVRRQMEEAKRKAEEEAKKEQASGKADEPAAPDPAVRRQLVGRCRRIPCHIAACWRFGTRVARHHVHVVDEGTAAPGLARTRTRWTLAEPRRSATDW